MSKKKFLSDDFYAEQLERLSGLQGFPLMPAAQTDLKRALRRASEADGQFIQRLVSQFVDDPSGKCPKPGELLALAGQWRQREGKPLGNASCLACGGSGWVHSVKTVRIPGMQSYEAECSARCACAPAEPKTEVA